MTKLWRCKKNDNVCSREGTISTMAEVVSDLFDPTVCVNHSLYFLPLSSSTLVPDRTDPCECIYVNRPPGRPLPPKLYRSGCRPQNRFYRSFDPVERGTPKSSKSVVRVRRNVLLNKILPPLPPMFRKFRIRDLKGPQWRRWKISSLVQCFRRLSVSSSST